MQTPKWDAIFRFTGVLYLLISASCFAIPIGLLFFVILPEIARKAEIDLQDWALAQEMTLISYHRDSGNRAGFLMPGHVVYRIVVEDREGRRRSGWISPGWSLYPQRVKLKWDPASPNEQETDRQF